MTKTKIKIKIMSTHPIKPARARRSTASRHTIHQTWSRMHKWRWQIMRLAALGCLLAGCAPQSDETAQQSAARVEDGKLVRLLQELELPAVDVFDRDKPALYGYWRTWSSLDETTRQAMLEAADGYVSRYRSAWGVLGLVGKHREMFSTPMTLLASENGSAQAVLWKTGLYEFTRHVWGISFAHAVQASDAALRVDAQGRPIPCGGRTEEGFVHANPKGLAGVIMRMYLAVLASWQVNGPNDFNLPNRDWDGRPLRFPPLPDGPSAHAQRQYVAEVERDFLLLQQQDRFDRARISPENIRGAEAMLRQLKDGSLGSTAGNDELLTPYAVAMSAKDLLWYYANGTIDLVEYVAHLNAFYYLNNLVNVNGPQDAYDVTDLSEGSLIATFDDGNDDEHGVHREEGESLFTPQQARTVVGRRVKHQGSAELELVATIHLHMDRWLKERLNAALTRTAR